MSSQQGGPAFHPVMRRTGLFGLFGKLAPSREFLQDKISECEWSIDREREAVFANGISRAYFVVFETQVPPSRERVATWVPALRGCLSWGGCAWADGSVCACRWRRRSRLRPCCTRPTRGCTSAKQPPAQTT